MPFHKNLANGQIHVPYNWVYVDATAREAATGLTVSDEGKLALQSDNKTLWMLTSYSPVTWGGIGSSNLANEDYVEFAYGTVTPLKIATILANKRLLSIDIHFDAPFNPALNDGSLSIGTLATPDLFVSNNDLDIELGGVYNFSFSYSDTVNTDVYLTISPGTSTTTGSGLIYVRSEP